MVRITFAVAVVVFITAGVACGNEIDGFRLGMSMETAKQLSSEKGYSFSNGIKSGDRWGSYILMKNRPSLSFCDTTLSAVSKQHPTNLHEATSVLRDWRSALGEPELTTNPTYAQGTQFSTIEFKWSGQDNVRRDITISQYGQSQMNVGFGYSYI